ncbi:hypothetical protein OESDEN_17808 [Oesophagostomum dentatum]|uniref:Uncharacterized protein n=1 Tax=Oesophagostomum dentatum TaxID=61180 RepID=A0A0B1SB15_OESDE|nr:hypothetical protein OESDEN_17808 [Oesophagostomum dentatum]
MYSMQPGPPLEVASLRKKQSVPLSERFSPMFGKAGQLSVLTAVVGALYARSLCPFVNARATHSVNDTAVPE